VKRVYVGRRVVRWDGRHSFFLGGLLEEDDTTGQIFWGQHRARVSNRADVEFPRAPSNEEQFMRYVSAYSPTEGQVLFNKD
jgi:hypothetical protein